MNEINAVVDIVAGRTSSSSRAFDIAKVLHDRTLNIINGYFKLVERHTVSHG